MEVGKTSFVAYLNTAVGVPARVVRPGTSRNTVAPYDRKVLEKRRYRAYL